MSGNRNTVQRLHPRQLEAVQPQDTVWLSASAGTGKTQVLSSRVMRLLLQPDVSPDQILCLTFTKAGATEMAARISDRLARWVRLTDGDLFHELEAIGAPSGPAARARARTLFAAVLDCPGGGLRIDTIHAFSQWLLGAFPHEADLAPGSRPIEDRERTLLARQVLAQLLVDAEAQNNHPLLEAIADLSLRMGADAVEKFLLRCAQAREAWVGPGSWQEPLRERVLALLGLPSDADETVLAALCDDAAFDTDALACCLAAYQQWNGKKGQAGRVIIADWLAATPAQRLDALDELYGVLFTQKGTVRDQAALEKYEPQFGVAAAAVLESATAVRELRALLRLAERLIPAFRLGRAFALAWEAAKLREGVIDFDDQIRRAADLLGNPDYGQWIAYKLDRQFDHILVDEAQDTNAAQWRIIDALTQEFFAGLGQGGEKLRTLFVVGDYKQAIFRFQGTSPENFERARQRVRSAILNAAADGAVHGVPDRRLREPALAQSYRTAQPVLDFVDAAIRQIGAEAFGLPDQPERHTGGERPGQVVLWRPVGLIGGDDADETELEPDSEADDGGEGWLSRPERELADMIARQVRGWIDHGYPLVKGREPGAPPRRATAGDVMVLLRKRGELASLIVARLHAAGVPVAGVDRLRLGAPLAVRDLMAALKFAAQPLDSLNLACLLVSPLVGWSQDDLLRHGYRDKDMPLWQHLRRSRDPHVAATLDQLGGLLAQADYTLPQALLHWVLLGPWQGRQRLVARLGAEANDPIDELLNAAAAYVASGTPSLAGFIRWFDAGDGELKREADLSDGQVRVMTVHGSKGLQAPIVILADATGDPERARQSALDLPDPAAPEARQMPLPDLRGEERLGRIADHFAAMRREENQEHWRLLYVAMTRAEEALFVGGALNTRDRGQVPTGSWYAQLQAVFGADPRWAADPIWGGALRHGTVPDTPAETARAKGLAEQPAALPGWAAVAPPQEPRPARPLAPSALGEESGAMPPLRPGTAIAAAQRGILMHKLLERLPELPVAEREQAATAWLMRNAPALDGAERVALIAPVMAVLETPDWAELFGPQALAEVPIAALVGDQVIAGTIDRLLVEPGLIRLVDFKTARRPPARVEDIPVAQLRQMAAYVAALRVTYPGRRIEAALLYTETPALFPLSDAVLAQYAPGLSL